MMTPVKTIAAASILAIDLGKYKSVTCVYRSAADHCIEIGVLHARAVFRRYVARSSDQRFFEKTG